MNSTKLFEIISIPELRYRVVRFNFTKDILDKAKFQARKKSIHTMEFNQSSHSRTPELKYQKQLQGILAEIAIKLLLEEYFLQSNIDAQVIRWDDIRTDDFRSPENEFDLKIVFRGKEYLVESRSSVSYKTNLNKAISVLDIIGPYASDYKKNEKSCDFYIRPLYQYVELATSILDMKTEEFLENNKMIMYIMCGITFDDLLKKGYVHSLGQGTTQYHLIKMIKCGDIITFLETVGKILLSKSTKLTDY